MKRIIGLLLCALLLAGCGGDDATETGDDAAETDDTTEAATTTSPGADAPFAYEPDRKMVIEVPEEDVYEARDRYVVGDGFYPGGYLIVATDGGSFSIFDEREEQPFVSQDFMGFVFITMEDGQELVTTGDVYDEELIEFIEPMSGRLYSGMYRVGTDIPAGEYPAYATARAIHNERDAHIWIFDDIPYGTGAAVLDIAFPYETTVELEEGDYVRIDSAYIVIEEE